MLNNTIFENSTYPTMAIYAYTGGYIPNQTLLYLTYSLPNGEFSQTLINNTDNDSIVIWIYNFAHYVDYADRYFLVDNINVKHSDYYETQVCEEIYDGSAA